MRKFKDAAELKSFMRNRKMAYEHVFGKPDDQAVKAVFEDLAEFCRAYSSTFHADPRMHAALEGRREVWLRIQRHLKLKEDELIKFYTTGKGD